MAEDQTRMAFMSDADEKVDPVSGNDVPPGSLPVEVRDDIDAKLSEGEYVVPADVVRFFGVKLFEDLRMEAKRGLAAMDEDGRIGGEPVPEEVYNDDEVVTDEDLEKLKGMLTTGMADGGLMDKIINAAKTDPTVNKVLNAQGVTVGMAEGGVVKRYANGGYQEGKVAEALKGVMGLVRNNPELQQMLASKGLKINTTGADKTAEAMEDANKPNKTTEPITEAKRVTVGMAEGGMVAGDPFDFEEKARASAAEGDNVTPAQMKQVLADFDALPQFKGLYNEEVEYLADEGSLVTAPNSTFNFQDWMTIGFTPATDMFSFLANNTEGLKMIKYVNADGRILELAEGVAPPSGFELYTPPAAGAPTAQGTTQPKEKDRRTGDESGPGPEPDKEPTPPPNYSEYTPEELEAAMDSAYMVNKVSHLGGLLGPIGALGGIAVRAAMRSRGIQIGNAAREQLKTTDKNSANYTRLQELASKGSIAGKGPLGWVAGKLAKKAEENAAAAKEAEVDGSPVISVKESAVDVSAKTPGLTAKQQSDADDRKAEKDRKAAEAAEKSRQAQAAQAAASYSARSSSSNRRTGDEGDNSGGSTGGGSTGGGVENDYGGGGGGSSSGGGGSSSGGGVENDYGGGGGGGGSSSGGGYDDEAAGDYNDDSTGIYKGGLIKKPKAKSYANGGYVTANEPAKKKKRKGLGTRP